MAGIIIRPKDLVQRYARGGEGMADVPQWQVDACKIVCEAKGFTNTEDWLRKVETNQPPTWGEIFGVLAKCL